MKRSMSRWMLVMVGVSIALFSCAQKGSTKASAAASENTLLWKISGNGLEKPSYLFGTIHLLCSDDAVLSENMKSAIKGADEVYFEIDMSSMMMMGGGLNMDDPEKMTEMIEALSKDPGKLMEIMQAMDKMKMNGDTTLQDLLSVADYNKVKKFFQEKSAMIPFEMIETFKPILAVSVVQQGEMPCDNATAMEQVVMDEAAKNKVKTNGLETLAYQAGIMDSIPLELQAKELLAYVNSVQGDDKSKTEESNELWKAYNEQDLKKLENLMMKSDAGMMNYADVLLYKRNENWVKKLKTLMPGKSLVIAVGAGHLPGQKGVIDLLRKAGYTVTPVENKLIKEKTI